MRSPFRVAAFSVCTLFAQRRAARHFFDAPNFGALPRPGMP